MLQAALGAQENDGGMSDTSQGPEWWLASDGKWYPPQLWTGPPTAAPPSATPVYPGPAPAHGGTGPYPYYGQPAAHGVPVGKKTNGLAIASLVCSCAGILFFGVPGIVGIVFGFVARSQIRRSNRSQGGEGLALAGIIVGFAWIAILIVIIVVAAANSSSSGVVHGTAVVPTFG
jgi:hypothetical protein